MCLGFGLWGFGFGLRVWGREALGDSGDTEFDMGSMLYLKHHSFGISLWRYKLPLWDL